MEENNGTIDEFNDWGINDIFDPFDENNDASMFSLYT